MRKQIIVTGSRDWDKPQYIYKALDKEEPTFVIQGGAKGADFHAFQWCDSRQVDGVTINANWKKFGKRAGMLRNIEMLEAYPDSVVHAFLKDGSRGTINCICAAKERGMTVIIHHYENV